MIWTARSSDASVALNRRRRVVISGRQVALRFDFPRLPCQRTRATHGHPDRRTQRHVEGASLSGRVLIGRRPSNHVVVDDPAVSRIHAWIDTADRQFCITDAGSRTGTFVNGQRVDGSKVPLRHGDRITVGPASLIFRADGSLPAGVSQLNFSAPIRGATKPTAASSSTAPAARRCGSPPPSPGGWASAASAATVSAACRRRRDERRATTAHPLTETRGDGFAGPAAAASPRSTAPADACGICQSPIGPARASTDLPRLRPDVPRRLLDRKLRLLRLRLLPGQRPAPQRRRQPQPPNAAAADRHASPATRRRRSAAAVRSPRRNPRRARPARRQRRGLAARRTYVRRAVAAGRSSLVYVNLRAVAAGAPTPQVVLAAAVLVARSASVVGVAVSYIWWLAGDAPRPRTTSASGATNHDPLHLPRLRPTVLRPARIRRPQRDVQELRLRR